MLIAPPNRHKWKRKQHTIDKRPPLNVACSTISAVVVIVAIVIVCMEWQTSYICCMLLVKRSNGLKHIHTHTHSLTHMHIPQFHTSILEDLHACATPLFMRECEKKSLREQSISHPAWAKEHLKKAHGKEGQWELRKYENTIKPLVAWHFSKYSKSRFEFKLLTDPFRKFSAQWESFSSL